MEGTLSEERVERRLAAILAADVAGYSRRMGEDEAGTLACQATSPPDDRSRYRRALVLTSQSHLCGSEALLR